MKPRPFLPLSLPLSALSLAASIACPRLARAQDPSAVQPVPYSQSQPVPYPGATPPPPLPPPSAAPRPVGPGPVAPGAVAPGSDVVVLKGGGMLRGTLIEALPNDHATVQMATGQTAIVPWERIERIDRGGAVPGSAPPGAPKAAAVDETTAFVHIESDTPVVLERREAGSRAWTLACASPCDAEVRTSGTYRIAGAGVRNSAAFSIVAGRGEHVVLDVNAASRGGFVGGLVLVGLGPVTALVGAMVLVVASNPYIQEYPYPSAPSDQTAAKTVGGVMIGVGAALTIGGILLVTGNAHSHVEQGVARPKNDAWLRLPTWRDRREDPLAGSLPQAVGVPLIDTTF